jgi:hypothetical protein
VDAAIQVTDTDHDNGYKDVEVELLSGRKQTVRVKAIDWRRASEVFVEVVKKCDQWIVLIESVRDAGGEDLLRKLTPFARSELLGVAWALTYGNAFQKKMTELGNMCVNQATATAAGAQNSS